MHLPCNFYLLLYSGDPATSHICLLPAVAFFVEATAETSTKPSTKASANNGAKQRAE